ncbi:DNA helicase [Metarhizium guizhouense ARSEF 977]|uniref:DNA helicase n=1 Tax=Metarhizium guizhouense (strain ARSEF 977) TaxID=1276136 RepID=A0A0B4HJ12_METGA|nr:DNA helicase [Metarhizium guizhouense ARSEF 977]
MSQPNRPAVVAANPAPRRVQCAIVVGEPSRRQFIGGKRLGLDTDIECWVIFMPKTTVENWFGFSILVPLSADTEELGLGKWHTYNDKDMATTTDSLLITVKFPRESTLSEITPVDGVLRQAFPPSLEPGISCQLNVTVGDPDAIRIEGIGMPFANPGHKCESWMRNGAVFENKTLLDILKSGRYTFVVRRAEPPFRVEWDVTKLPPPFQYPWGTDHYWDEQRYHDLVDANKGPHFAPAHSFDSDNSHLAVLTQSLAQDIIWVDRAAKEIYFQFRMRVYFIGIGNVVPSHQYYVLVPLEPEFRTRFEAAWRRLAKQGILDLHIFDEENLEEGPIANWVARIVDNPQSVDALANHVVENYELILHNCAALRFDSGIDDYVRKIDAVCQFAPNARPSNPALFGVEIDKDSRSLKGNQRDVARVNQGLEVARAAVRGRGFYGVDIAVAPPAAGNPDQLAEGLQAAALGEKMPILPRVNMLNMASGPEREALMRQLLPVDRDIFATYLKSRPLGLGLATGGPGFGKTSLLSVAAYAMIRTFDSVYVSAPTNVAVDNIAARIYETSRRVVETANGSMESGNPDRLRRLLVIRGYKPDDEMAAFLRLLQNPDLGDQAAPESA